MSVTAAAPPGNPARRHHGFTLVELAVVLAIIAMMLGGLVVTLSAQVDLQRISETRATLENIREALMGFAAANGRLPCPASGASSGQEAFSAGGNALNGNCSNFYNGFLPAAALGITPTDTSGFALDGWGNRIRYAAAYPTINGVSNPFTRQDGMKNAGMQQVESYADSSGLLFVCSAGPLPAGTTATACPGSTNITKKTPAVIFSAGRNAAMGGTGADEAANVNGDGVFVTHPPTAAGAGGEFDDVVTWVSLPVLFNRLMTAGRLP